jgi:hypothetical protein
MKKIFIYIPDRKALISKVFLNRLSQSNIKPIFIVRRKHIFKKIGDDKSLYVPKVQDVEDVLNKNYNEIKKIYYLKHHPKNIHAVRDERYEHIFVYDFKKLNKSYRIYDKIVYIKNNPTLNFDKRHLIIHSFNQELKEFK